MCLQKKIPTRSACSPLLVMHYLSAVAAEVAWGRGLRSLWASSWSSIGKFEMPEEALAVSKWVLADFPGP